MRRSSLWIGIDDFDGRGSWVGEAMGDVDFKELKAMPDKVAETVAMAASSGAHLARLLKGAGFPGVVEEG